MDLRCSLLMELMQKLFHLFHHLLVVRHQNCKTKSLTRGWLHCKQVKVYSRPHDLLPAVAFQASKLRFLSSWLIAYNFSKVFYSEWMLWLIATWEALKLKTRSGRSEIIRGYILLVLTTVAITLHVRCILPSRPAIPTPGLRRRMWLNIHLQQALPQ